jgi:cation transport protein ChaC
MLPDVANLDLFSAEELAERRLQLPVGEDFWVFGYGSLIWHPGFPHLEVRPARVSGYHRRFCLYSHRYRGTPRVPGLVLGLDRGGSCRGLVFRVPAAEGEEVLDYLYEREMITGAYFPRWVKVATAQGPLRAMTFVVDTSHEQYTGRLGLEAITDLVVQGCGDRGTCLEYLEKTVHHLEALGLGDATLKRLLKLARARLKS